MPIYVYRCQQCGSVLERRQSFRDPPLTTCEACSGELRRVLQPVGVIFKGSGFYSTDSRHNGAATAEDGKPASSKSGEDGASKPAESASAPATSTSDGKASSAPSSTSPPTSTG